jgi:hypothetical protein
MKKTGAIIMAIGALIVVLTAFNFTFTTEENVIDAGNFQINQRKKHKLPWPPIVGVAVMVVGGGVYLLGIKKSLLSKTLDS